MEDELKENLSRGETWLKGLFILIFALIYNIAEIVMAALVIFQFLFTLVAGHPNERLLQFGRQLSLFLYQVFQFITFNREDKPFPFDAWPEDPAPETERRPITTSEGDDQER